MGQITELRTAPLRRCVRDRVRMIGIGVALFALTWLTIVVTDRRLTGPERVVFRAVDGLPDALGVLLRPVMFLGTLSACAIGVPIVAIVYRRFAPAIAVALGCWTSYVAAQIVKSIVGRGRPEVFLEVLHLRAEAHGFGYASGHAAVVAGAVAALAPWLGRRGRVIAWVIVGLVALARVYVGVHLPLDVIGGVGIGMVCGTLATIAVGTPDVIT